MLNRQSETSFDFSEYKLKKPKNIKGRGRRKKGAHRDLPSASMLPPE